MHSLRLVVAVIILGGFSLIDVKAQAEIPGPAPVSGIVTTATGTLGGVTLTLEGVHSWQTISRGDGYYQFLQVDEKDLYTVTPTLSNYTFIPASRSFLFSGSRVDVSFTAVPNELPNANPLDEAQFFVRQQYLDFLGREPDQSGLTFWTTKLTQCGIDTTCLHNRRIDVSAAFFASEEFQEAGSFVYRLYEASLGRKPTFAEFSQERSMIVAGPDLAASKDAYADAFMESAKFTKRFPESLAPKMFVTAVIGQMQETCGVDLSSQYDTLMALYASGSNITESRCNVMLAMIEDAQFKQSEYNEGFVMMQYFGYLQRDVDQNGFDFWINVLDNQVPGNHRSMICAFITSREYQLRFAPVATHFNTECSQ